MTRHKGNFIDGSWKSGEGAAQSSVDPATDKLVWTGHGASKAQVDAAVGAARAAFLDWAKKELEERIHFLHRFGSILKLRGNELAEVISQEMGKPLWESDSEVRSMVSKIAISIEAYQERCPERVLSLDGYQLVTRHKPHGVLAVLGPFNFPGHLPNGHIVPALLAGNTVVCKVSEITPYVGILMAEYWNEAGLPPGVFNLVQGGPDIGQHLSVSRDIDGLCFTGSARTGQQLAAHFGFHVSKISSLEMGGNNPLIIYEPSSLEAAAYTTLCSGYLTSGQRCTAARRLIVLKGDEGDAFLSYLGQCIDGISVGHYSERPEPFMGPVASAKAAHNLLSAQCELLRLGAEPLREMRLLKEGTGLLTPGLLDVTSLATRNDEEIFGPLLQVIRVRNFEEAIHEANDTSFGLSAGILTRHRESYEKFFLRARAGVINWNTPTTGASSQAPFGGVGRSGNHRPTARYAADYCAYPVASLEAEGLKLPEQHYPGIQLPELRFGKHD